MYLPKKFVVVFATLVMLAFVVGCSKSAVSQSDLDELRSENEQLRSQLAAALATPSPIATLEATPTPSPTPTEPPEPTPEPTPAPGQFSIEAVRVTYNIIGNPEAVVTVRNTGPEPIDAFEVIICGFSAFGERVGRYSRSNHCFEGIANDLLVPINGTYTGTWTLFGQETAENVEAEPHRSRTTSGAVWQNAR